VAQSASPLPFQQGRSAPFPSGFHRFRFSQCGVRFFATLRNLALGRHCSTFLCNGGQV
jgi:hypothetical protein